MHRHVWEVKNQVTQLSPWELMNANADGQVKELKIQRAPESMFQQPVIVTYQCVVCAEQKVVRV